MTFEHDLAKTVNDLNSVRITNPDMIQALIRQLNTVIMDGIGEIDTALLNTISSNEEHSVRPSKENWLTLLSPFLSKLDGFVRQLHSHVPRISNRFTVIKQGLLVIDRSFAVYSDKSKKTVFLDFRLKHQEFQGFLAMQRTELAKIMAAAAHQKLVAR
jgi:hypothetical protein